MILEKTKSSLVDLYLWDNKLNGTISEVYFDNLTKLQSLELSYNLLTLKFNNNLIPPFQLQNIRLLHYKLVPDSLFGFAVKRIYELYLFLMLKLMIMYQSGFGDL